VAPGAAFWRAVFVILGTRIVTSLLIVNVALFLPVVLSGIATSWLGWVLAGRGGDGDGEGDGDGGLESELSPLNPWPVGPCWMSSPDDLARSA
jgi:hypothetical protein